jgi:erythromycin esterase
MWKRILLVWMFAALSGLPAQTPPSILGYWEGILKIDMRTFTLIFRVYQSAADITATLEVPEQNASLPLRRVKRDGNRVVFELRDDVRYEGELTQDGRFIQGVWKEGVFEHPLTLRLVMASHINTSTITAWVKKHAIPLKTVEAGSGFEDMAPLKQLISSARIVAVGEATHGTREFFQLKHRIFEFLVEQMGFTVFAIEANLPEARPVNDYILTGGGDPREALEGLYSWTWKTEEVLSLIKWMRAYNADPAHKRKVKFYGFDMQMPNVGVANVLAYLQRVDPEYAKKAAELLSGVPMTAEKRILFAFSAGLNQKVVEQVGELLEHIDSLPHSETGWSEARRDALVVRQAVQLMIAGDKGLSLRDEAMAANVEWILDQEGPESKIMLWAHNGHVRTTSSAGTTWMGGHLRRRYGNELVTMGFVFNQGSFQAMEVDKGVREFTVGPAPSGSLDAVLAATKIPLFAVDLRTVDKRPVADWFRNPQKSREVGANFSENQELKLLEQPPAEAFDVLLFVEKTSRARTLSPAN